MRIAILGTGEVGRRLAEALASAGHDIVMGTREPGASAAKPPLSAWLEEHPNVRLDTYRAAAHHGEVVFLAASGSAAVAVATSVAEQLSEKILIDVTNPLDFSAGFPPRLFVSNDDSLGEQVQRAVPDARVVKTLNTVTAALMVNPQSLSDGRHTAFVSGDDPEARAQVAAWLVEWLGWGDIVDLGDMASARGTEALLLLWVRLMESFGTTGFQFAVVRPSPTGG